MSMELGPSSFSLQIAKLFSDFDRAIGTVTETSTGRELPFHVGRILESLLDCGLSLSDALTVMARIEPRIHRGIETRDISSAIILELERLSPDWVHNYRAKYDGGITMRTEDCTEVPLRMAGLRAIIASKASALGFEWGNGRLLDEVTRSMITRCRKLCMSEVSPGLLDELFQQEVSTRLGGYTICEYRDEMPAIVASAARRMVDLAALGKVDDADDFMRQVGLLSKALLFHCGIIPPTDISECLDAAATLFDRGREPDAPLRLALADFVTGSHTELYEVGAAEGLGRSIDPTIKEMKAAFRRLSYFASKQSRAESSEADLLEQVWSAVKAPSLLMARFCEFIWPEAWLTATTAQRLRHDMLRNLYRYRAIAFDKLTRMLQVHPKHSIRALNQLHRDGLVTIYGLQDGNLILITPEGEHYCERSLALKLRCPLSGL